MNNKLARGTKDRQLIFAYLRPSAIEATWGARGAPSFWRCLVEPSAHIFALVQPGFIRAAPNARRKN
jgi:hypothetical protein